MSYSYNVHSLDLISRLPDQTLIILEFTLILDLQNFQFVLTSRSLRNSRGFLESKSVEGFTRERWLSLTRLCERKHARSAMVADSRD